MTFESYLVLFNCFQVYIQHVAIKYTHEHGELFALNVLGKFVLNNVRSEVLRIAYNDSRYTNLQLLTSSLEQNELNIHKFQLILISTLIANQ